MDLRGLKNKLWLAPMALALVAAAAMVFWLLHDSDKPLSLRIPGTDQASRSELGGTNPVLAGMLIRGEEDPAMRPAPEPHPTLPGAWPQFRGPNRDDISPEQTKLARRCDPSALRQLWGVDVGEGYAGPAVREGRVYLMDYDRDKKQDALRCLSLENGHELWRYAYPVRVKRNHGMSRTVPAVTDKLVVAIGPKCHVVCAHPVTGELRWGIDLVRQYGATVPQWYAGQCPLVENNTVILAPGGRNALLMAVDGDTGEVLWRTPNPKGWKMTHSSIMPAEFGGQRMYLYCADKGVVAVGATNGAVLWETTDWKIKIATVPSPLVLDGGRVFLSGGYDAGSLMLQIRKEGDRFSTETVFKLEPKIFGALQHTPILHEEHIYGVRADGRFACLTLDGKPVWVSDPSQQFGYGPFLAADGLILAMNDSGVLREIELTPQKYKLLGEARVLQGRESWGPMALAGRRLLVRDLTRLACLELAGN